MQVWFWLWGVVPWQRLADATPELSSLTATGALGWYAWHTATRTLPHLVTSFRAELAAAREACRQERRDFLQALAIDREQRHRDTQALIAVLGRSAASNKS